MADYELQIAKCKLQNANCRTGMRIMRELFLLAVFGLCGDDGLGDDFGELSAFVQQVCHSCLGEQLRFDDQADPTA